jgi:hypothetical protein
MFGIDNLPSFCDFVGLVVLPMNWRLAILFVAFIGMLDAFSYFIFSSI